jgi:uncharacterized protein
VSTIVKILDNYDKLCAYCDGFFSSIHSMYADDMRCAKGCSACCELHSVCALEAHVITRNIVDAGSLQAEQSAKDGRAGCIMLKHDRCAVYASRPVICRTHGLAISMDKGRTACSSCELNFTVRDATALPGPHVLDAAAITDNLMRLNLAFCMALGSPLLSSKRFTLASVLSGGLPKRIL